MRQLLILRERIRKIYQDHSRLLNPLFHFLFGLMVFAGVNMEVGYNPGLKEWYIVLAFAIITAILPMEILMLMASILAVMHIYYVSFVLAVVFAVVLAILYFVYVRFVPQHGLIIMSVPVLFAFHIPYMLPILLGLFFTPAVVLPMTCGIVLYGTVQTITTVIGTATDDSILLFNQVMQQIFVAKEMYVTILIFAIIVVVVYFMRNREFAYSFELSILTAAFLNIVLFLIINYSADISTDVINLIVETVGSALLALTVQFVRLSLNYYGVENLQFEDEEYYYYVKAVPKMSITAPSKKVKRFNAHLFLDSRITHKTVQQQETPADTEDSQQDILDKHDFDFKVSLEEDDFKDKNK